VTADRAASGQLDVVAVGNALVDVLSHDEVSVLAGLGLDKGVMTMVDHDRAERIYEAQGPTLEVSGGSAANTIAGLASFGSTAGFIGKVGKDDFGRAFAHDLDALGVIFGNVPASDGGPTGRCHVIVTPDADRTMCTFLGVASELGPDDVDEALITRAEVTYLEGYLFDQPAAKDAFRHAAAVAHRSGRLVALTLSDPFCVSRHRDEFLHLVEHAVEILFANEEEICALYEVDDFDDALQHVRHHTDVAALTRGKHGSIIVAGDEVHVIDAVPVDTLVDTTGAGDQYAAGFLHGLTAGRDLATCGHLGSLAASECIAHLGPRPETSLAQLAKSRLS
jgi:sugar/nucleoside kinase (ribokinase family)